MKKVLKEIPTYYMIFLVYALIGWLYEVFWLWFVVPPYHFVNRGVLFGPFLPIYGFGMLILLVLLKKFMSKKHEIGKPIYLLITIPTITTFIYTTIVEYTTTPKIYSVLEYLSSYGIGLLIVNIFALLITYCLITFVKDVKKMDTTIIIVFLLIWIITTVLEYVSHYVSSTFFNMELWNYSKDFLNIKARVNWDASRNFAIGGTFLLYTVQPLLDKYLPKIKNKTKILITIIIGIPMILDLILHVLLKLI